MIDVLVPVLGRPMSAQPLAESLRASEDEIELRLVFLCSPGDEAQIDAVAYLTDGDFEIVRWPPKRGDYARKINYGYSIGDAPYVFTAADDVRFHRGWAEAALRRLLEDDVGVCGTNDLANPTVVAGRHSTHSLVARDYVDECGGTFDERPGVLLFEGYDHQLVDNELRQVAVDRECWTFAADSIVEHLHPLYRPQVERDATYEKGLAQGKADRRLYERRYARWRRGR